MKNRDAEPAVPLVSVVVPTYNQAGYLPVCLDSIWFQDYENLEIVVVDDASTDGTRKVLDDYAEALMHDIASYAVFYDTDRDEILRRSHPRYPSKGRHLRVLRNETNRGSTRTYNRGFRACKGVYCTYVASDDFCHPDMIRTLVNALEEAEADFAYSDMLVVDDRQRVLRRFTLPDYSFEACFRDWYLCGVSKLHKRSLHERFGYYDEDYLANDHELYLRFAKGGVRFTHVPRALYSVRHHGPARREGVHAPANWTRLVNESKRLVRAARDFMQGMKR